VRIFFRIGKKFVGIRIPNLGIRLTTTPEYAGTHKQKQTHAKLEKSARNPPEIRSPPEIFFACQTIFQIRQTSGGEKSNETKANRMQQTNITPSNIFSHRIKKTLSNIELQLNIFQLTLVRHARFAE
jgi:hypothetical protein